METNEERRRFFRIDDSVRLSLRRVSQGEMGKGLEHLEADIADSFSLMSSLNAVSQQVSACLHRIENKDPDIADYLKALDRKVDLLGKAFLAEEVEMVDQPARAVNLRDRKSVV